MMLDRLARFKQACAAFPESVHPILKRLPEQGGKLNHDACQELMKALNISLEELMLILLPVAGVFARVPVSGFCVGAVAQTESGLESSQKELYLGANLEFENLTLNATIHAEQSAALNAWHQNGGRLLAVATSETPCGHCRQFLHEFYGGNDLAIIQPGNRENDCRVQPIAKLLPQPFTPANLNTPISLMAQMQAFNRLKLLSESNDPVVAAALEAANAAYAPYSGNLAGCSIQARSKQIVSGRSMESVAFNPSVPALHAAVIRMNLMTLNEPLAVERIVLVERTKKIRQKETSQTLIKAIMPDIMLEYYLAQEETE